VSQRKVYGGVKRFKGRLQECCWCCGLWAATDFNVVRLRSKSISVSGTSEAQALIKFLLKLV